MDNIRNESFLGSDKVIVGNKYTDLILETLGKVYIKTGNSSRVLSDVLALLDKPEEADIKSQTIIVNSTLEMEEMEYPGDGFFIYNTLTTSLYISYDSRYISLIEVSDGVNGKYVRRKGDSMTGPLEINTVGAPLIIASSQLIGNLNAEFINGYSSSELAKKRVDEYIYGNWTFKGKNIAEDNWIFKENIRMHGDIITSRSLSTPEFSSGFSGYGWRLDSDTNTLTIDNLIVRKAMRVYEMVINRISATNGSIWVSNSSKCDVAVQPIILTDTHLKSVGLWSGSDENKVAISRFLLSNTYYVITDDVGSWNKNLDNYQYGSQGGIITLTSEISKASSINTTPKTFVNYKYIIHVKDVEGLVNSPLFEGVQTLYDEDLLTSEWSTYTGPATVEEYKLFKQCISLIYIAKEKVVTEWDGTYPKRWQYRHTFDRDRGFFMIPKDSTAIEDFETNGSMSSYLTTILPYYKYFGLDKLVVSESINTSNAQFNEGNLPSAPVPNLWIVSTDKDEYPLFKAGDILRCQKYTNESIKYYDALVTSQVGSNTFVVMRAPSVFDIYTEIKYNEDGSIASTNEEYNSTQYRKTEEFYDTKTGTYKPVSEEAEIALSANPDTSEDDVLSRLDDIVSGDDMIQIGNIFDVQRQNAIYLTSSDDQAPYIDVISGLNRPDYSVLYSVPIYEMKTVVSNQIKRDYYIQEVSAEGTIEIPDGKELYYGSLYPTRDSIIKVEKEKYKHTFTKTTRVRIGNLSGVQNEAFGKKQPYGFGLYGENVFLTGEFYLNNGSSVVDFAQDGIFLKYKRAGLSLIDVVDADGKPVYLTDAKGEIIKEDGVPVQKQEIKLTADQIKIGGEETYAMFSVKNVGGKDKVILNTDLIDAESIKTYEISNYSYSEEEQTIDHTMSGGTLRRVPYFDVSKDPAELAHNSYWAATLTINGSTISSNGLEVISNNGEAIHLMSPIHTGTNSEITSCTVVVNSNYVDMRISVWLYDFNSKGRFPIEYAPNISQYPDSIFVLDPRIFEGRDMTKWVIGVTFTPYESDDPKEVRMNISKVSHNLTYREGILNWSLNKDGSGNLGRGGISWKPEGDMLLTGKFQTNIGGKTITLEHDKKLNIPQIVLSDETQEPLLVLSYGETTLDNGKKTNSGFIEIENPDYYTRLYAEGVSISRTHEVQESSPFTKRTSTWYGDTMEMYSHDSRDNGNRYERLTIIPDSISLDDIHMLPSGGTTIFLSDITGFYRSLVLSKDGGIRYVDRYIKTEYREGLGGFGYWEITKDTSTSAFPDSPNGLPAGTIYRDFQGILRVVF